MRLQETYLEKPTSQGRIAVIKTYDIMLAREAFDGLSEAAIQQVTAALHLGDLYESEDIPSAQSLGFRDFVWETLSDEAREDGQTKSFFIVTREVLGRSAEPLYVSADWPSAEVFVRGL